MNLNTKFNCTDGESLPDATQYCRIIGLLLYLTVTHPDITFVDHKLSQFISQPQSNHLAAAHTILWYLKSTIGQGIIFSHQSQIRSRISWIRIGHHTRKLEDLLLDSTYSSATPPFRGKLKSKWWSLGHQLRRNIELSSPPLVKSHGSIN